MGSGLDNDETIAFGFRPPLISTTNTPQKHTLYHSPDALVFSLQSALSVHRSQRRARRALSLALASMN